MVDKRSFYRMIQRQCIRHGLLASTDLLARVESAGQLMEEPGKNKMVCQLYYFQGGGIVGQIFFMCSTFFNFISCSHGHLY